MTEIFVFGSNLAGRHGKGAALHARKHYGAVYGQATGRQGDSYATVSYTHLDVYKRQVRPTGTPNRSESEGR